MQHPKYKEVWSKSAANEFGRLTNGLADGRIEKPTKTIRFIRKEDVPADRRRDVTYGTEQKVTKSHETYDGRRQNQLSG